MMLVLNKYTNRKRTREWNVPTDKERQIVVLKALLEEFCKESFQFLKYFKDEGKGGKEKGSNKLKDKLKGEKRD